MINALSNKWPLYLNNSNNKNINVLQKQNLSNTFNHT